MAERATVRTGGAALILGAAVFVGLLLPLWMVVFAPGLLRRAGRGDSSGAPAP